jgi:hypothetical protein
MHDMDALLGEDITFHAEELALGGQKQKVFLSVPNEPGGALFPAPDRPDIVELQAVISKRGSSGSSATSSGSDANNLADKTAVSEAVSDAGVPTEQAALSSVAEPAPIDVVSEQPAEQVSQAAKPKQTEVKPKEKAKPKAIPKSKSSSKSNDEQSESARGLHPSVMNALRSLFPYKLNNADLISAFVYIHTGGKCVLTERAEEAVSAYKGDKEGLNVAEAINNMARELKKISASNAAIELGTAFSITDRLFNTQRASTPKDQVMRDSKTLDILTVLRREGHAQVLNDNERRGREIHKSKSVNNYNQ